jgi:HD-GYP domain-containing protein (c-di-GMP phosphodiesterase class II)
MAVKKTNARSPGGEGPSPGGAPRAVVMKIEDPTYSLLYRYTKALSVALGFRDMYTRAHSDAVVVLSERVGERCGLSEKEMGILRVGAAFHDVGKIGMPDQILLKPSRLDGDEFQAMKEHAAIGEEIMLATELEGAAEAGLVVRHHHEHWDGNGYPDGLAGERIPICSRIIGIADSYDAMAVTRPYHRGKTHEEIMEVLREETGKKHDPRLMDIFHEVIGRPDARAGS